MAIQFKTLWNNYPSDDPCRDPKTGKIPEAYSNQCAIKVGYALEKSGVSFASFQGGRCPFGAKNSGLVAGAQNLANWLETLPFAGCPKAETYTGKTVFEKIDGRGGIIFLADYWQRTGETGDIRTGDHIDLWNGSRMTSFSSWFRVQWGISWDGVWSDFTRAKRVKFWPIR
jgi:hypothetical protein